MVRTRIRDVKAMQIEQQARQPSQGFVDLSRLLHSHTFSVCSKVPSVFQRICHNLQTFGGQLEDKNGIYIGEEPKVDAPSIGLDELAGTLGPFSTGFLNNIQGIAAFSAPISERPKQGTVAVIVPRRESLPEIVPLLCKHQLGISWVISVGDGDPAEVLRFLSYDPATTGVLVALGRGTRTCTLHQAMGRKPTVFFETDSFAACGKEVSLCRASVKRAGAVIVTDLEEWLAHGSLFDAKINLHFRQAAREKHKKVTVFVLGAGKELVLKESKRAQLASPISLEVDDKIGIEKEISKAAMSSECLVFCGDLEQMLDIQAPCPILRVDPAQPERLRAVLQAAAFQSIASVEQKPLQMKPNAALISTVTNSLPPQLYTGKRPKTEEVLSDHDTKRFLHAYGVKVSRQAPANSVTAAARIASKIGFPVVLLSPDLTKETLCLNLAELKHQATLALAKFSHVMLREHFPVGSRVRVQVTKEKGINLVLWVDQEAALLPIMKGEAKEIATKIAALFPTSVKKFTECLGQICACSLAHALLLQLEMHISDEPVVVKASGLLDRTKNTLPPSSFVSNQSDIQ